MKYPRKLMRPFENHWQPLIAYENVLFVAGSAEFFVNRTTQINWKEEKKWPKRRQSSRQKQSEQKKALRAQYPAQSLFFRAANAN